MSMESIPLHIRCSGRNLIDKNYPLDDAAWWKEQEVRMKTGSTKEGPMGKGGRRTPESKYKAPVKKFLESGLHSEKEIREVLGMTKSQVNAALIGLSVDCAIYETSRDDGTTVYGLSPIIRRT